ncbi:PQQ-binding-like beta-propeller repeat protein [Candidatus Latescibacterota bacterium]
MKKWKKWSLGILGVIVLAIVVFAVLNWSTITILMGTEELSGDTETIPTAVSRDLKPIEKGSSDWTSWLGTNGDNRSAVTGIITDLSGGLKKRWEVNYLCQGNSSATWSAPVIQGNRLIVCGRDKESDLVFCIDPVNGDLLWHASYTAKVSTSHGSGPRATPFIDDDRVYTFGRNGDLVCWSLFDGKKHWHANVADKGGEPPTWGHSSSPFILGENVIVQGGGSAGTIAYDKMTGNMVWTSGNGLAGYAAVTKIDIEDTPLLLAFHGTGLAALDGENGNTVWNVPWETSYDVNATTPVVNGEGVFVTSGYKTGCMYLKAARSGADVQWRSISFSSIHSDPHVIDGFLFGYSGDSTQNRGVFKCIDLGNGIEKWSTNEMGWGTSSYADGYLLCLDIKGNLFLMQPGPEAFVIDSAFPKALGDVKGPVWTKPIVANGFLYLRFKQRLVCYEIVSS